MCHLIWSLSHPAVEPHPVKQQLVEEHSEIMIKKRDLLGFNTHALRKLSSPSSSPMITKMLIQPLFTAISRKVVGKSARDNTERYCGWLWVHCFPKNFQRMARDAMDVCLRVLKESNKSRFDSYSVRNSALIISHITFRDCHVHSFSDNLSRNSCIHV